ncbi:MAG TPA: CoA-binding protein, partial [Thermodesulfobacteriota bacterium]|nr:CoA-binding protein [Thermodesulfobacteriota bacterium]
MESVFKYFFEPRSVAVIGASKTPGKAGNEILVNMQVNGYAGKIFPVNPGGEGEILGLRSYRSVTEIPEAVDLAAFIVPAEKTLGPLRECAEKKVPAAVISSGGYAEVDEKGARLQEEILKVARAAGMRIIGPNTSGLTSMPASLTTTFFPLGKIRRGPISYIAQTGNFATHTMRWIMTAENFGVARVAGLGNKIDIEDSEVLDFLGGDPETRAVLMYVEGFREPRRFLEVA